jgi:hypothetical protein
LERSYAVHPVTGHLILSRSAGQSAAPSLIFVDQWRSLLSSD